MNQSGRSLWSVKLPLLLGALSVALYLPGIRWGMPGIDTAGNIEPWGWDEIAPVGPLIQAYLFKTGEIGDVKYPPFHFLVDAAAYSPYLAFQMLTGQLKNPHPGFPYGFADPVSSLAMLLLIARGVSLLMGAATAAVAYFTATALWDRTAGVLAGISTMLMYPMFYYAKTSNVDVPAMFWCSLVFLISARVLRDGWNFRRAAWMGVFAALAVATKDQSYAILLLLPLGLLPAHFRALRAKGQTDAWNRWKAPLFGLLVSAATYAVASGLAINPRGYFRHLDFIRTGWVGNYPSLWYFRYSGDWKGYLGLFQESAQQVIACLGWPLTLVAFCGIVLCAARDRSKLVFLLPIPLLLFAVILPVRHTAIRFMLPLGFVLACFAAYALALGLRTDRGIIRGATWLALVGGCGFALLKGADLTYLMLHDSRYTASAWFQKWARPGDVVDYFHSVDGKLSGRLEKFPRVPEGVKLVDVARTLLPGHGKIDGEFVLTIGAEDQRDFWFCPATVYYGLLNGSLGYELVATIQTGSLFSHPHFSHPVNPRIEIFARRDRAAQLGLGARSK